MKRKIAISLRTVLAKSKVVLRKMSRKKDQHQVQYFEVWLGACSINYSIQQTLPYAKTEDEVSHYLWFNPQVSIADMFRYLKNLPVNIDKMHIKETRLNWYIQEAI